MSALSMGCASAPEAASDRAVAPRARGSAALPPKAKRHVEVQLYATSMCPYAAKLVTMLGGLREHFDLDLHVDYIGTVDTKGVLGSMRGEGEVAGDRVQLCAAKSTPRWLDVLLCQDADLQHVDENWGSCARSLGLDEKVIADVMACAGGDEGSALLTKSFVASRNRRADASPTIYVDGESYEGPRGPRGFVQKICSNWMNRPEACEAIPPLFVTILSDAKCPDCNADALKGSLESRFDGPTIELLDVASPEGAKLYAELGVVDVPAVVVEADAPLGADADAFKSAKQIGTHRFYSTHDWNPRCNAAGGCDLPECAQRISCRTEEPQTIDLYMMGLCPFAAKGILALGDLFDELGKKGSTPNLRVHFIGSGTVATGLSSMHGPAEVDEDLRDVCVMDHYPEPAKFLPYLRCRAKDHKQDWKTCTGGSTGIDAAFVEKCVSSPEAKKMLEDSFAASAAGKINASPSWIANGKYPFKGIKIDDIKLAYCGHNSVQGCASP